ncbi:MAG TPA: sialate O-acetylesterase [Candidatus Methylacidiphilales bacterium]
MHAQELPPQPQPFEPGNDLHLYLLMGQSNMLGRDTTGLASQVPDPEVGALDGEGRWVVAVEPIGVGGTGFGPGTFFAAALRKAEPGLRIGLVQCAVGGTPLSRWVKGADLYENAVKRARIAMRSGTLDGVLWHQGESDSNDPALASTYGERLTKMLGDLRADLGLPRLPIVVGQLGEFVQEPHVAEVREAIRKMPEALPLVGYADSRGLGHKGDHLHFNVEAEREMGNRYAEAMRALRRKADEPAP